MFHVLDLIVFKYLIKDDSCIQIKKSMSFQITAKGFGILIYLAKDRLIIQRGILKIHTEYIDIIFLLIIILIM